MTRAPREPGGDLRQVLHQLGRALSGAGKGYSTTCPTAWFHLLVFAPSSADVATVDGDLKASAIVGLLSEGVKGMTSRKPVRIF